MHCLFEALHEGQITAHYYLTPEWCLWRRRDHTGVAISSNRLFVDTDPHPCRRRFSSPHKQNYGLARFSCWSSLWADTIVKSGPRIRESVIANLVLPTLQPGYIFILISILTCMNIIFRNKRFLEFYLYFITEYNYLFYLSFIFFYVIFYNYSVFWREYVLYVYVKIW